MKQISLLELENTENKIEDHWVNMPAYENEKEEEPLITVTIKFKTQEDYENFNNLLKTHIYKTNKVFDGMQTKTKKQAWFPLKEKASKYIYK